MRLPNLSIADAVSFTVSSPAPRSALLEVENLRKYFPVTRGALFRRVVGHVKAVDGVSFSIGIHLERRRTS